VAILINHRWGGASFLWVGRFSPVSDPPNNGRQDMTDFNFIVDPEPQLLTPEEPTGELSKLVKMTPRKFAQSVLDVFDELGGMKWLLGQAVIDPRGFLELLKKILPRNIQAEGLEGITVRLVDQYGNAIEIDTHRGGQPVAAGGDSSSESGQLQIATSGNPPDIVLQEMFE